MEKILLTEKQASSYLTVNEKTLQSWRFYRKGPTYVKVGRLVRYPLPALEEFLRESLPSRELWKRRGRKLALFLAASVATGSRVEARPGRYEIWLNVVESGLEPFPHP